MNKLLAAALAGVAMIAAPAQAQAQDTDGKLQIKLLGTYVATEYRHVFVDHHEANAVTIGIGTFF